MEDATATNTTSPEPGDEPAEEPPPPPVEPGSLIADVIAQRPDAARVLQTEFELPCYRCEVRYTETLAQGIGYSGHDIDAVVARLNRCPPRDAAPR